MNRNKIRLIVHPKNEFKNCTKCKFFSSKNMSIPMKLSRKSKWYQHHPKDRRTN